MNHEPEDEDVLPPSVLADINWLAERIPHVSAWCYGGDGFVVPVGLDSEVCTSDSCADYRLQAAGALYEAGARPPIELGAFFKQIDLTDRECESESELIVT